MPVFQLVVLLAESLNIKAELTAAPKCTGAIADKICDKCAFPTIAR